MSGDLQLRRIPAQRPRRAKSIRVPGGRVILTRDRGEATLLSDQVFASNLRLIHRGPVPPGHPPEAGVIKDVRDTGSGLVTNAGVNLMSNDFSWTTSTLKATNFHAIGTGATAAAATDVWLQTAQGTTNLTGTTNGYMTGTQSIIANATGTPWSPIYQTSATFSATGAIAVTEWILAVGNGANVTGTATATTTTSLTVTGTPLSANAQTQWTVEALGAGTAPINTPTTTAMLQIASNTTSAFTGIDNAWTSGVKSWLSIANQAVATPSATTLFVAFPTAWDHKVFSVVNLANGDTLQTIYQLSINSGG